MSRPEMLNRLWAIDAWLFRGENDDNPNWSGVWNYYERLRDIVYPNG